MYNVLVTSANESQGDAKLTLDTEADDDSDNTTLIIIILAVVGTLIGLGLVFFCCYKCRKEEKPRYVFTRNNETEVQGNNQTASGG